MFSKVRVEAAKNILNTLLGSVHLDSALPKRKLSKELLIETTFVSKFGPSVTEDLDYCVKRFIKGKKQQFCKINNNIKVQHHQLIMCNKVLDFH